MDAHVRRAVRAGLRRRGVNMLTAGEDGNASLADPLLLDRATALGRVLFNQDEDLLREAQLRQQTGAMFAGVIYTHQLRLTVGQIIQDLELIPSVYEPADMLNRGQYLPL